MKDKPTEPMDEFTDEMHSTFTISDESDRKFRVWTVLELLADDYPLEQALEMSQSSLEDYEEFKGTYPED